MFNTSQTRGVSVYYDVLHVKWWKYSQIVMLSKTSIPLIGWNYSMSLHCIFERASWIWIEWQTNATGVQGCDKQLPMYISFSMVKVLLHFWLIQMIEFKWHSVGFLMHNWLRALSLVSTLSRSNYGPPTICNSLSSQMPFSPGINDHWYLVLTVQTTYNKGSTFDWR